MNAKRLAMVLVAMGVALPLFSSPVVARNLVPIPAISVAWGAGGSGQLGGGAFLDNGVASLSPSLSSITNVTLISAGSDFALALLSDCGGCGGTVVAWGDNSHGQLGDGTTTNSSVPVPVVGLTGVKAISAGGAHALALLANGTVMAWGSNSNGQLGDGTTTDSDVPVPVQGVTGATTVQAGGDFSTATVPIFSGWQAPPAGTLMVWGGNAHGQLGIGSTTDSDLPVPVTALGAKVRSVRAGPDFTLAILANWTVQAWGDNADGQLGNGTTTDSDVPEPIGGISNVTRVAAGGTSGYALERTGALLAWGDNSSGQLGNGTTTASDVPEPVAGLSGVWTIAAGGSHVLAMLSHDTVMAWGNNANGQLGNGTTTNSDVPVAVPNLRAVKAVAAGTAFSLVRAHNAPASLPARDTASAKVATPFTKVIKARSLPDASTIQASGVLPAGVTFVDHGNNTATLSGVPAPAPGTYNVVITATNGLGTAAQESLSVIVRAPPAKRAG